MVLKDISFVSPLENILYDEVLLSLAEGGCSEEVLRFWESPVTVIVLGRARRMEDDVKLREVRRDHIPVVMRYSGGGTVIQGRGCLNYSLILSKGRHPDFRDLHRSYRVILDALASGLQGLHVDAIFKPVCDLALGVKEKKFSGNAQHRGRHFFLHHGTILYDFDLDLVEEYLKVPDDVPDYRQGRTHRDFLINLPLSSDEIKKSIADSFGVTRAEDLTVLEKERLDECVRCHPALVMPDGFLTQEGALHA